MRLHVLMMAYNNDRFIRQALEPLLEHPDVEQIMVVEGAWSPNAASPRSEDKTIEILHELEDANEKLEVFYWNAIDPENYPNYQCDYHKYIVCEGATKHPYYDPLAFQQQLMARDFGLRAIMSKLPAGDGDDWLFIVDSDEVYEQWALDGISDFLDVVGSDYDFMTVMGYNFYFGGNYYHPEWYRRLFKLRPKCFFSDDNSLEIPGAKYTETMNFPEEDAIFYHYGYVGEFKVKKKLEMWRQDSVEKWWEKHGKKLKSGHYDGEPVHLFGDINPGYRDYTLVPFRGRHPAGIGDECELCEGSGQCDACSKAGGRCGCGGECKNCNGSGRVIE